MKTANQSRQQRRHKRINADGKVQNVIRFLEGRAKSLPKLTLKGEDHEIDHSANLKAIYMAQGI